MDSQSHGHIVMLPFMAHGHLIPFLALARRIRRQTPFVITLATTPLNLRHLCSTMSPSDADSRIRLYELPFCSSDHRLPPTIENTENTENLSPDQIVALFHSGASLAAPVERHGTKSIAFTTAGAYGTMAYVSLWLHLPRRWTDAKEFSVPGFPEWCRFHRSQLHRYIREADTTDEWSKFFQVQLKLSLASDGWFCNSVEEIEPLGFDLLKKFLKLAIGLESSGKPFIWVIRPPLGFNIKGEFRSEWLPPGFEDRVTGSRQGLLVRNWAPQLYILSHRSTGAFLSHCGWNSIVESLSQGVPIVGWAMAAEQAYNAKMIVEEMGVCVELTRGIENQIDAEKVQRVIELVLEEEGKGGEMKKRANAVMGKMREAVKEGSDDEKGSSVKAIDEFDEMDDSQAQSRSHGRVESRIDPEEVKQVTEMVSEEEGKGVEMKKRANAVMRQMREAVKEGSDCE
ncbi:hypothetical protein NL676_021534 [Syzygium grande]|nr:hypothetical protein NL676_021534 [Syzygium grande]